MTTSAMTSVRKKWKSSPARIRLTWKATRRTMGRSRNARSGARRVRDVRVARTSPKACRRSTIGTV